MSSPIRVTVIFDNLGPYHVARLNSLSKICELLAVEIRAVSANYAWKMTEHVAFERVTLFDASSKPLAGERSIRELMCRLDAAIRPYAPSVVVIPGWGSVHAVAALLWARKNAVPVVVMAESQEIDFHRTLLKEWAKRRYLVGCEQAIVGGQTHHDYLLKLGMSANQIHMGYDVVDNVYFQAGAAAAVADGEALRMHHALPRKYFLASARFIEKKNLPLLIRAYANYRERAASDAANDSPWELVLLGDGELRVEIESLISDLGLGIWVHLPGFRQYPELPIYYGLASAFILASTTEQWGLVVNEAMASGLPVIVSERCGCAQDLVREGQNGFAFDPFDRGALTDQMLKISSKGCDSVGMGLVSREIITKWSPELFAMNLLKAANAALVMPRTRNSFKDTVLLNLLSHFPLVRES